MPSTRFVGREHELFELDAAFEVAVAGGFCCVLLLADPGVGKTRLAQEMLQRHEHSATGLTARAHPLSGTASFGLWSEALERHLRERDPAEVLALADGLDDLAILLRSVAVARGSNREVDSSFAPASRLLDSLGAMIAKLAVEHPLIVVLDDIHLADPSSWDVLHYLAGHPTGAGVLVLAVSRSGQLSRLPAAMRVLLDMEQQRVLRRMVISPLTDEAIGELAEDFIGAVVSQDVRRVLCARSRGNAFFALGLLQALRDRGLEIGRAALEGLPEAIADGVRARVGGLPPTERDILEILAVAGDRLELRELTRVTNRPLRELAPALESLVSARLIEEDEIGSAFGYDIAHPLIQETVHRDLGGARRLVIHREVGRALLARGRLGEAAPHFARSAEAGDDEAIEVLLEALCEADRRGAYREGVKLLGVLGELMPVGDERWGAVAEALPLWAFDHRADGDTGAAAAALLKIAALPPDRLPAPNRAAIAGRLVTMLAYGAGDFDRAIKVADEAIELFRDAADESGLLRVTLERAYVTGLSGDIPSLEKGAREVLERAEAAGNESVVEAALGGLSSACFTSGDFTGAEAAIRRAIALTRHRAAPYRAMRHLMNLGWILGHSGDIPGAYQAFADAKEADPDWRQSIVLGLEAHVRWLAGDFAGVLACAEESTMLGLSLRRGMAPVFAALAGVEVGALPDARHALGQARALYGGRRDWYFVTDQFRHADAVVAWCDGRHAEALAELQTASANLIAMGAASLAVPVLIDLAEFTAELQDAEAAADAHARVEKIAAVVGRSPYDALSSLAAAHAMLARGIFARAIEPASRAVELLGATGYRGFHGRALVALGHAYEDTDLATSIAFHQQAAVAFDEIGAAWRRNRVMAKLRALGPAGRRAADTALGVDSLTAREREVARLTAQRLTAQQIADLLVVSRRTVESHIASTYIKLNVHSKADLIRALAGYGLA